jgi:uncharacterized protein (TIGR02300 family)
MPELGIKFECGECGTKFYDLGKPAAVCPKCGTAPKRDAEVERKVPLARLPDVDDEAEVAVPDDEAVAPEVTSEEIEEEEEEVVEADDE